MSWATSELLTRFTKTTKIMKSLAIPFIVSFAGSLILLPLVRHWGLVLNFTDKPGVRKVHSSPIPALGGTVLFLTIASFFYFLPENHGLFNWQVFISLASVLFITGLADDKYDLPALLRLGIQVASAVIIVSNGVYLKSLFGLSPVLEQNQYFMMTISVLFITGTINAFNLIDGLDGLSGGLAFINTAILSVLAILSNQYDLGLFVLMIGGMLLAFLVYNFHPAKLFLGDSGSLVLGFLFSVIFIRLSSSDIVITQNFDHSGLLFSLVALPVFDTIRLVIFRLLKGRSPFSADKNHIHHIVLQLAKGHTKTSYIIFSLHIVMTVSAALLAESGFYLVLTLLIMEYLLFISYFKLKNNNKN